MTDDEGHAVSGVDLTALATTAKLNYYLPDLPYYRYVSQARSEKATYRKSTVSKRTAILSLDYDRWSKRARLDTMKYYQFAYPGKKMFAHEVKITDSTQFAIYVMKNGAAKQVHVIEVDKSPVYYSWSTNPNGFSFYADPDKPTQVTLRLHDRVLIIDSLRFARRKKTILSMDLNHLPKEIRTHKIAPVIVTERRRKRTKWALTSTEINRHNSYLAVFEGTLYPAYIEGDGRFVAVSSGDSRQKSLVVGPITSGMRTYTEKNRVTTTYKHAGGYSYSFEDNIVYKKDTRAHIPEELFDLSFRPIESINDVVINKKILLTPEPIIPVRWHPHVIDLVDNNCRVKILLPAEEAQSGVSTVLFQNPATNTVISPCKEQLVGAQYLLPRGFHNAIVMYNNGSYLKVDSVALLSYSNVVADMKAEKLHPSDEQSRKWKLSAIPICFTSVKPPVQTRSETLKVQRIVSGNVHGIVYDDTNQPLPGISIVLKGTTIGTITDAYGRFALDVYEDPSVLIMTFIGYVPKELEVSPGSEISVVMEADVSQLMEVVVVGYGAMGMTKNYTSSVSGSLQGKVAGVTISGSPESFVEPETKTEERERQEAEQRLYQELLTLKDIRSHFSDVAFWEPRLFTDKHGRSKFTVTFPDDITRWDVVVYGMNRQLKTGTARKSIGSFKPLMAELHTPRFLVVGDSSQFLGKVLNYTGEKTIHGKTKWTSVVTSERGVTFNGFHTETLTVIPATQDSITTSYAFTRDDGYFDGEERKVPVILQGTLRANGKLSVLENGNEVRVQAKKGERVKIEVMDNPLYVYAGDAYDLVHYRYDCNEQLASKLIGLLNYKLLMRYENKEFKYDKDVNKIVARLLKNQNNEFLWSWWDVSPNTSFWMSAHILRALKAAKDAGYNVNLDIENITRKATYKFDFLKQMSVSDVDIIHSLATWDARIDYAHYIKVLDKKIRRADSIALADNKRYGYQYYSHLNEKLLLMEVRQLQKLPFERDSLLQYKKQTILNEVYFDDNRPSRCWYYDELSTNAIAYRIIKRDSAMQHMKTAMQMYFLSVRRKGSWNTYQTSNVLMSILSDLIATGSSRKVPSAILLSGKVNSRIEKFPYLVELNEGESLHVKKTSGLPLYYMEYTEERVTKAAAGTDGFKIKTAFSGKSLMAGQPVMLRATVEIRSDAKLEHVMIEIPIPGGCSYGDKRRSHSSVETHREYFKEKTVVFCENMTPGIYTFEVELLPRFTGTYHVNPSQVSLMYFPVIQANTDMQSIKIH